MGYDYFYYVRKPIYQNGLFFLLFLYTLTVDASPDRFVKFIGVKEGLSQNTVYDIAQDKDGYIWSATGEGLNQFDGNRIKTYYKDIRKPFALKANMIRSLMPDIDGSLWIGTDKSIYHKEFRSDRFKEYRIHPSYDRLIYYPLLRKKEFLFGTIQGHAIFRLNLKTLEFKIYPYQGFINNRVIPDMNGDLWFCDSNKTLIKFETSMEHPQYLKTLKEVYCIGSDIRNNIYAVCGNKMIHLNLKGDRQKSKFILSNISNPSKIKNLESTLSGIWIQYDNGNTWVWDKQDHVWNKFKPENLSAIETHAFHRIFEDKSSNIWIATNGNGMIQVSPYKLHFEKIQTAIQNRKAIDFIKCFSQDTEGRILVGTHEEGLLVFTPDLKQYRRIRLNPQMAVDPSIIQIYSSNNEEFFIATSAGLYSYNNKKGVKIIESERSYWGFTTKGNHLFLRNNSSFQRINKITGIPDTFHYFYPNNIRFSHEISGNKIFAAHKLYGAAIISLNQTLESETLKQFDNLRIFSLYKFSENRYFLTTDVGIIVTDSLFNIQHSEKLPEDLPQRHIYGLLKGKEGDLWGSSNKGLIRISFSQNRTFIYNLEHGLQSMEFNSEAFFKDRSGRLFFGGISGFNYFNPDALPQKKDPVPVYLSEIKINQEILPYSPEPKIKLPGKKHDLQLNFSTPEFTEPENTELFIQLRGAHPGWINLKNRRTFYQAGISPGVYTLLAKTRSPDGVESEVKSMMHMEIEAPFFRKPINIALMILISLLIVSGTLRRRQQLKIARLQSERELEMVRKNIYRDLHDELGAGLSRIKILTDLALLEQGKKENGIFRQVSETAAEVTGKLREIVWAMNPRNENLRGVLLRLQANTEEMLKYLPLQYEFHLPKTIPDMLMQPGTIRNLLHVYQEILNNIQKYSRADKVVVAIKVTSRNVKINITDNGIGFDVKAAENTGNGLRIMKDRVKESGGSFNLYSEPGKGTQIDLMFMLKPILTQNSSEE